MSQPASKVHRKIEIETIKINSESEDSADDALVRRPFSRRPTPFHAQGVAPASVSRDSSASPHPIISARSNYSTRKRKLSAPRLDSSQDRTLADLSSAELASPKKAKRNETTYFVAEKDLSIALDETIDVDELFAGASDSGEFDDDSVPTRSLSRFSLADKQGNFVSILNISSSLSKLVLRGEARPIHKFASPDADTTQSAWTRLKGFRDVKVDIDGLWVLTNRAWYLLDHPETSYVSAFADTERYIILFTVATNLGFTNLKSKDLDPLIEAIESHSSPEPLSPPLGRLDVARHLTRLKTDLRKSNPGLKPILFALPF